MGEYRDGQPFIGEDWIFATSDGALEANTLVQVSGSTDRRVVVQTNAGAEGTPENVFGVTLDGAAGAGVQVRVFVRRGKPVFIKKDATAITRGNKIRPSTVTAGYCQPASGRFIGIAFESSSAGSGTLVLVALDKSAI